MRTAYPRLSLRIGGEAIYESNDFIDVVNPATGEVIAAMPMAGAAHIDAALTSANVSFAGWSATPPYQRAAILRGTATLLRERKMAIAGVMTTEQGKPHAQASAELAAAADLFDWFAEEARRIFTRTIPGRTVDIDYHVNRIAIGPVAAFTPWNFPATSPARKIAAALAAGCTMVLKPAEETPATALAIADALNDAGLPPGVLNILFGNPAFVAERLVTSPMIRKVSLTGSTRVGRLIGALAGQHLKPVTLELGGHAPVIVAGDADLDRAVELAGGAKFRNSGQVCIAPTRFLVDRSVADAFADRLRIFVSQLTIGAGSDASTTLGPLANERRRKALEALLADAAQRGASIWRPDTPIPNRGFFMSPAIVEDAPTDADILNDEPFGPVALLNRFDTLDAAVAEANRLPYGLAAYGFATAPDTLDRLGRTLRAGMIGLNSCNITIAETPFGGVGDSGFGREGGSEGLDSYLVSRLISMCQPARLGV